MNLKNFLRSILVVFVLTLMFGCGKSDEPQVEEKNVPTASIENITVNDDSILFDLKVEDNDKVITAITVDLLNGDTVIQSLDIEDDYDGLEFTELTDGTEYKIALSLKYDLNDGNNEIVKDDIDTKKVLIVSEQSIVNSISSEVNKVNVGEQFYVTVSINESLSLEIESAIINGIDYQKIDLLSDEDTLFFDVSTGNVNGDVSFELQQLKVNYDGDIINYNIKNNNNFELYVFGKTVVTDVSVEDDIVLPGTNVLVTIALDNILGYDVESITINNQILQDFVTKTATELTFYVTPSLDSNYHDFLISEIVYKTENEGTNQDEEIIYNVKRINERVAVYISHSNQVQPIRTIEDLKNIDIDSNYILMNDIDLNNELWLPINRFNGYFDGNGHVIKNLTMQSNSSNTDLGEWGFFGMTGDCYIKDLKIENVNIDLENLTSKYISVAGLVGYNKGTIANSSVDGIIVGSSFNSSAYYGGLVGWNEGKIYYSSSDVDINISSESGTINVGGLAGINVGDIDWSYASGNVKGTTNAARLEIGGLVGALGGFENGNISNSFASGNVEGTGGTNMLNVGGFVGFIGGGEIINSYATGDVKGTISGADLNIGGFAGIISGTVSYSYATGDIQAEKTNDYGTVNSGGFVGNHTGNVTYSIATGDITVKSNGNSSVGKFVGNVWGTRPFESAYYYDKQVITVNGTIKADNSYGQETSNEVLNSSCLYKKILEFDQLIWDIEDGRLPIIK